MKEKRWVYKSGLHDRNTIIEFSKKNSVPPVISMLLFNRGIDTVEKMQQYFSKSVRAIHNPKILNDCEIAAERIIAAVNNNEKIAVYGDYDVDGITSTALIYDFLKSIGADAQYYIPDRITEGYGMNIIAVNKLIKKGVKLIITVDCGVTAVGEIEFAVLQKTEVIVTDHHTCKEKLPRAYAILNPKRPDNEYPFEMLAGVGVAFKLMLCIAMKLNLNTTEYMDKYSDLTAIGTVSDVVSLTDENRAIVHRGILNIRKAPRPGVEAILNKAGIDRKVMTASDIAFGIAPRINAAGRMGNAQTGLKLLLEHDINKAAEYADILDAENEKRKVVESKIYEEAISQINSDPNFSKKKVIVVCGHDWHEGVIGIVASKIMDLFYKPTIVLSENKGICKGSGRSIAGFDLFEALSCCEHILSDFGGHSAAAGLSLGMDSLEKFIYAINKYADEHLSVADMTETIEIDCEISSSTAGIELAKKLSVFEPYGEDNQVPVFSMKQVSVSMVNFAGRDNTHLKMTIAKDGKNFNCIGFRMGDYVNYIKAGDTVDIAFGMSVNNFKDEEYLQFVLKDIKLN